MEITPSRDQLAAAIERAVRNEQGMFQAQEELRVAYAAIAELKRERDEAEAEAVEWRRKAKHYHAAVQAGSQPCQQKMEKVIVERDLVTAKTRAAHALVKDLEVMFHEIRSGCEEDDEALFDSMENRVKTLVKLLES